MFLSLLFLSSKNICPQRSIDKFLYFKTLAVTNNVICYCVADLFKLFMNTLDVLFGKDYPV